MPKIIYEISKWFVVLALTVVMAIAGAWLKGDVYTKEQVDDKIEHIDETFDDKQRQIDRIDKNVQMLVDKLIHKEN